MPRSRDTVDASLELLLDTITNTFGSVLFITMLVAVLLRVSGQADADPHPLSKADQAKAEARAAELSDEVERLAKTLDSLPVLDPTMAGIEGDITSTTQNTVQALSEHSMIAAEIIRDQEKIAETERKIRETQHDLENIAPLADEQSSRRQKVESEASALAKAALELDRPVDPTQIVQTAHMPELTTTEKDQFGVFMRYGRLYVMHERGPAGQRLGPDPKYFLITSRPDGLQVAKARPDAGHIADAATVNDTLRQILGRYPADKWVIAIVVHEDSFAQFQTVKAALVNLGYQYEPITARAGDGVWDSGGHSKRGQ